MTSTPKLDNNADPEELLKRPLDQVHFKFDEKEEAYRGCAKLKAMHDKVRLVLARRRARAHALTRAVLHDVVHGALCHARRKRAANHCRTGSRRGAAAVAGSVCARDCVVQQMLASTAAAEMDCALL
jgi:hypothetical protein